MCREGVSECVQPSNNLFNYLLFFLAVLVLHRIFPRIAWTLKQSLWLFQFWQIRSYIGLWVPCPQHVHVHYLDVCALLRIVAVCFLAAGAGSVEVRLLLKNAALEKGQGKSFHLGSAVGESKTASFSRQKAFLQHGEKRNRGAHILTEKKICVLYFYT